MPHFSFGRAALLLTPALFLGACSVFTSSVTQSAYDLDTRLQARLAANIQTGQAGVRRLPDGAQVTLAPDALFPGNGARLDDNGKSVLASVIEGLLAPNLTQIAVTDSPDGAQGPRAIAISDYFTDYGLGPTLDRSVPVPPDPTGAPPSGITITIRVSPG